MMNSKEIKLSAVVVHYDEIGLKGKNRSFFENLLIQNIKNKLKDLMKSWLKEAGQVTLELADDADKTKVEDILTKIPGIAFFSFAHKCEKTLESMAAIVPDFIDGIDFYTFKVDTRRHDKHLPFTSMDANALLGAKILERYPDKKVRMKNPDMRLIVELTHKHAYICAPRIPGVGGFPTNAKQKVVALLSGGFDSPVASYMMMKRGCEVVFAHFLNENTDTAAVESKILEIAEHLAKFQQKSRLYIVNFGRLQNEIIMKAPPPMRMLVYRRFMAKIAAKIAAKHKAPFLVTGDSLSQVASQTIENLQALYENSEKHILSPLIGLDKKEIIDIAHKIGTFGICSAKCQDLCSYYLPKHPMLRATPKMMREIEENFDIDELVHHALENTRLEVF